MSLTWIQALKKWNEKSETWCIPRKGSKQYDEVKALMNVQPIKQQIKIYQRVAKEPEVEPAPAQKPEPKKTARNLKTNQRSSLPKQRKQKEQ